MSARVCPQTGQTHWWLLPTINLQVFETALQVFEAALAAFAAAAGAGPQRQIVRVLDRAGWHSSRQLQVPAGVQLVQLVWLPPYSPELQPAERLWPLTNEPLANRSLADANGLQLRKFNGFPSATMRWKDVRAWAVVLPYDLMPIPPTYAVAVFSDLQTLTWEEPTTAKLAGSFVRDDRHEAYVAAAQRLHALIAARTGQPLHQIVPQPEG